MAKGKSQYATWRCSECKKPAKKNSYYNKRGEGESIKVLIKYCNGKKCRKHVEFRAKDTRKGN